RATLEVAHRHAADLRVAVEAHAGAVVVEGPVVLLQRVGDPAADLLDLRAVREREIRAALHDDGLELLSAHDRAEAGAPGDVLVIVHDARDAHALLARRADLADARKTFADLGLEQIFRVEDLLPPHVRRVADLDLRVLDEEVHGCGRRAGDDDAIPSASPNALESGDFAPTECREAPDSGVPVSTPIAKTSTFSGASASVPGLTSDSR